MSPREDKCITEGNQENNAPQGFSNLPSKWQIATSNHKTFDTPYWVKFIKNILIGNIRSFFLIMESLLPLQSPVVK
jgi:hypothetical protein